MHSTGLSMDDYTDQSSEKVVNVFCNLSKIARLSRRLEIQLLTLEVNINKMRTM